MHKRVEVVMCSQAVGLNRVGYRRQTGVALLEAMLGFFILGVGLLGMASLQNQAVRDNNTAYLNVQATWLANSIAEKMRANRESFDEYAIGYEDTVTAGDCESGDCTPAQLADWDLQLWRDQVAALLPQGEGEVQISGDEVVILVRFDDDAGSQSSDDDDLLQVQVSTRI